MLTLIIYEIMIMIYLAIINIMTSNLKMKWDTPVTSRHVTSRRCVTRNANHHLGFR